LIEWVLGQPVTRNLVVFGFDNRFKGVKGRLALYFDAVVQESIVLKARM